MQIQDPPQAFTLTVAGLNALTAAITCFIILLVTAFRRVGGDEFNFFDWLYANRNRWIVGIITLTAFSALTVLTPDVSAFANGIGFNLDAKVPLSLGVALAAFLATTTKAAAPKKADQGDV